MPAARSPATTISPASCTGNNGNGRFVGGLQAGGDWQFAPNWVVGAEAQYSWLSGNVGAVFPGGFAYTNDQRGLGSITGRVGYTWGPGLLYVKGGYAYSDNNETRDALAACRSAFATDADHKNGYTIGVGVEYMFAPNWSAKAEYMYYNFGDARFTAPAALVPGGSFTTDDHAIKAGVNYRFNLGRPGGRAILIAPPINHLAQCERAGASRPFLFAARNMAQARLCKFPDFINPYRDTAAARIST